MTPQEYVRMLFAKYKSIQRHSNVYWRMQPDEPLERDPMDTRLLKKFNIKPSHMVTNGQVE